MGQVLLKYTMDHSPYWRNIRTGKFIITVGKRMLENFVCFGIVWKMCYHILMVLPN